MSSDNPRDDPNAPLYAWAGRDGFMVQEADELRSREERYQDPAVNMTENDLHAGTGQVCPVCHQAIANGQAVRLRIDGTYQHDPCP